MEVTELLILLDAREDELHGEIQVLRQMRQMLFETIQDCKPVNTVAPSPCEHGKRFCLDCHGDDVLD